MDENRFLNKIKRIINSNIGKEDFGVRELASELGFSRSQTLRRVKALTGKSANHFIRETRLKKAIELLKEDTYTASEIAYKVGFSSPSYFNKCFHDSFGITPGDYKNHRVDKIVHLPKTAKIIHNRKALIAFILICSVLIFIIYTAFQSDSKSTRVDSILNEASIAVLPLLDLSKNKNMEYMAIGLTDAITLELSKIKGLRVISRGSTMIFQDSIIPYSQIAENLNVNLLLEGSVIFSSDSLRVTVQLIEPLPKEKHIWANKYEQNFSNIIELADNISTQIANEIGLVFNNESENSNSSKVNPNAYKYYLRGKLLWQNQNPESIQKAISYLNKSIQIDSTFAPSYSCLADCYVIMNKFIQNNEDKFKNRLESHLAANNAMNKAIGLDSSLAEAYITKGKIFGKLDWNWEEMKEMADKGLGLNPNNPYGHILLSKYWAIKGNQDRLLKEAITAEHLDPLNPMTISWVCYSYLLTGKYNEAIEKYHQVLELFPNHGLAWNDLGIAYYLLGEKEKAKESWKELHEIMGNYSMAKYFENENFDNSVNHWLLEATTGSKLYCSNPSIIAIAHLFVNQKEGALDYLELAYKYKNEDLPLIMLNPVFKNLYDEPRFNKIAHKVGITKKF
ncbi:helix-turn-helix domain-containing protein [Yeosuana sp. MJ-SS3]|uniref:Helix-turn-helix domain-containing protein n=1 Tax=Gilvirhabdus luticola TaxID=3079858 RepID=A0ABU3U5C1_9FLAO|nr:helix-turn-helix domain-containing protein [Yeosuana sp. MJ-SS3]MDU8885608.1 helix-turn-helix domain-containing protein [Yeosuana sp. MJ-SS3]